MVNKTKKTVTHKIEIGENLAAAIMAFVVFGLPLLLITLATIFH